MSFLNCATVVGLYTTYATGMLALPSEETCEERVLRQLKAVSRFMLMNVSYIKGEGHSRNGVFFEIANKKIILS